MAALQAKVFSGKTTAPRRVAVVARAELSTVVTVLQPTDRRQALAGLASVAALVASKPANAAYGDAANIFGKTTSTTGFIPYAGEGFALLLPSKWNPSKEQDFNNLVLRYEDNGDSVNCLVVLKSQASKPSIEAYGSPDAFLAELQNMGLFGKQSYTGSSKSEGGFADGRYAAASLLDQGVEEKKGKKYYTYDVLVRSADGDEGGRHQLIKAAVGADGKLYILKVQIGDKRWFKGAKKDAVGAVDSFVVA